MKSHEITWEDENCNRHVQFSISYLIEDEAVKITEVTPTKVSFTCPETKTVKRSIRVHTETGQQLLANHFANSGQLDAISKEIEETLSV